jgi:Flp pilus assembly protein TadD/glutathione synthase/RimK-type ligase-like ATP-grasp enzyme
VTPSGDFDVKNGARVLPAAIATELVALYSAAKWARLVIAARPVTTRYPGHLLGWQASGKALLQLGKAPEAVDMLSRVVKLAPGEADGYNDLGNALHQLGRTDEAVASYRRAVELDPRSPLALANLAGILCGLGQSEESAACCRRALDIDPGSAIAHNNLGNALREAGRPAEAEASYRQSLTLKPDYLEALINLGSVLGDLGRWAEAISGYRLAVQMHPGSGIASNALGRSLSRLKEDDEEALRCLERAIALNAHDTNTYVELGNILMRKQQTGAALGMFRNAQKLQPLITWRANQERADFSALFLDTPMAGSTPVDYLAGRAGYDRHFHCVIPDTPVDLDLLRAKADVVFNMICNADDGKDILVHALDLVERLGRPTINHPRLIMNTDRETIARRLAGIPCCVVPRTVRVAGPVLAEAASSKEFAGCRLPQLVRVAGTHGGDDFDKFENWDDIGEFVAKSPEANYYMIDYVDYRSHDGLFRKYRVIFIDGETMPYHLAIHDDWKVHHFRTDMANQASMREEEERFLADMGSVFNPANQDALRAIARATGLDYGGVDCGLDRDGRIVVFEANASMLVHDEKNETFAYKNQYIAKVKNAFDAMLSRRRRAS